jgi:hypothetical protein
MSSQVEDGFHGQNARSRLYSFWILKILNSFFLSHPLQFPLENFLFNI